MLVDAGLDWARMRASAEGGAERSAAAAASLSASIASAASLAMGGEEVRAIGSPFFGISKGGELE